MNQSSKIIALILATLIMLAYADQASAQSKDVPSVITVSLPSGGTVDIRITSFENRNKNAGNKTVLAVHGLAHTGATFDLLAKELFKQTGNDKVRRVLALNFPGRNGSGLPSNVQFGTLTVEDYTAVLLGVLEQLPEQIKIETIVGHSMGGLIVQTAQNSLRSAGTSLQGAYGVKNVYLLAPSIPNPLPWSFADSGVASAIAQMAIAVDPDLGAHLRLISDNPAEQERLLGIWLTIFFTDTMGRFVEGAPLMTALKSNYVANEALIMTLQLLGASGFARPEVKPGIFDERVQKCFRILAFSEDLTVPGELVHEYQNLDKFLTGDAKSANVVFVDAPNAVHDMLIANPIEVAAALTSCN
jgi:pimeloyl-ACP methyl ester carboxylesterase